jgi:hypothetical protein
MINIQAYVKDFFLEKRSDLLNKYIYSSVLGNQKSALNSLSELIRYNLYENNILSNYLSHLPLQDELTKCLEECDINLIKLRKKLENLRGVDIDTVETTLIVYVL